MTNAKKIKTYVKYANFPIGSAATKYTLHVDRFTGNLGDALKNITSNHSLHLMLIMMVILKNLWVFNLQRLVVS